jgi:hypothetical protein
VTYSAQEAEANTKARRLLEQRRASTRARESGKRTISFGD